LGTGCALAIKHVDEDDRATFAAVVSARGIV
jgi:hypothetical protein